MKQTVVKRFVFIVFVALISVLFAVPADTFGEDSWLGTKMAQWEIALGLDLKGGTELDYKIDLDEALAQNNDDDPANDVDMNQIAESVRDALEERVNPNGVGEVTVKRSQVDNEQHILIQLPPNADVASAKANAEKDNRLSFYEESPEKEMQTRLAIAAVKQNLTPSGWAESVEKFVNGSDSITSFLVTDRFKDQIRDPELAEALFAAQPGQILDGVKESQTEIEYEMIDGQISITNYPKPVIGIIALTDKKLKERTITNQAESEARHILFAYEGAVRAPEGVPYKTKEDAKAKAEEILARLQNEGTENFTEVAKEFSTEEVAQSTGGTLGLVTPDSGFVPAFKNAMFGTQNIEEGAEGYIEGFNQVGLIPELVETEFGYHIIEMQTYEPESTETVEEEVVSYEMLAWDKEELLWEKTDLGGAQLEIAQPSSDQIGKPVVELLFNDEGAQMFSELTRRLASRQCPVVTQYTGSIDEEGAMGPCRLGIKVGENFISLPQVTEPLYGKSSVITGNFTYETARQLADDLNLGAIDAPVKLMGDITIKAEIGEAQLAQSIKAGAMGLLLTMLLMIILYRWAGIVASLALLLYAGLYIMILKVWVVFFGTPIVVSLSGVAGIALSIGLAVDANILIFERMKEELHLKKRSIHQALDLGFERAWSAIKDTNFTTFLTCIILITVGSSVVKGFAFTLMIGTILSLFTAITISRTLLRLGLLSSLLQKPAMYGRVPKKSKARKNA